MVSFQQVLQQVNMYLTLRIDGYPEVETSTSVKQSFR